MAELSSPRLKLGEEGDLASRQWVVNMPPSPNHQHNNDDMDCEFNGLNNKRKYDDSTVDDLNKNRKISVEGSNDAQGSIQEAYEKDGKGPFEVWVRYNHNESNLDSSSSNFNIYNVGRIVNKKYSSIKEIKKNGRSNGIIVFGNRSEANAALKDKVFLDNKMKTFIPNFKKERKGVLKGIPIDICESELIKNIVSPVEVLKVKRLNRKNKNSTSDADKWIPTTSILISFSGDELPKEISIYYVLSKIHPYIRQPTQCFNCFRFGHVAKVCHNKKRCSICGESHDENIIECQDIVPRCANCKQSHKSISKDCPIYLKNRLMFEKVAIDNILLAEARKLIFGRPNAPMRVSRDFPQLKNSQDKQGINTYSNALKDSLYSQEHLSGQPRHSGPSHEMDNSLSSRMDAEKYVYVPERRKNDHNKIAKENLNISDNQSLVFPIENSKTPPSQASLLDTTNKLASRLLNKNKNDAKISAGIVKKKS